MAIPGQRLEDQFLVDAGSCCHLQGKTNGGAMGLLEGKNALIFGLANDKSIAWGITQAFHREGANIGISYQWLFGHGHYPAKTCSYGQLPLHSHTRLVFQKRRCKK